MLRVQLGGKEERVVATEFEQESIPQELMTGTCEVGSTRSLLMFLHTYPSNLRVNFFVCGVVGALRFHCI